MISIIAQLTTFWDEYWCKIVCKENKLFLFFAVYCKLYKIHKVVATKISWLEIPKVFWCFQTNSVFDKVLDFDQFFEFERSSGIPLMLVLKRQPGQTLFLANFGYIPTFLMVCVGITSLDSSPFTTILPASVGSCKLACGGLRLKPLHSSLCLQ